MLYCRLVKIQYSKINMKKNRNIILTIAAAAVAITLMAFTSPTEQKLKAEFTLNEWNKILEVIEQSNAPHQEVKAVQQALIEQLQPQINPDSITTQNQ